MTKVGQDVAEVTATDHSAALKACKNITELSKAWSNLPAAAKNKKELKGLKDEIKASYEKA
jgi:hypothetical protein